MRVLWMVYVVELSEVERLSRIGKKVILAALKIPNLAACSFTVHSI